MHGARASGGSTICRALPRSWRPSFARPARRCALWANASSWDERGRPSMVFYDGACGLMPRNVRFAIARDRDGSRFRFAALGGEAFRHRVPESARAGCPTASWSSSDGSLLTRSGAIIHILERLGGPWDGWEVLGLVPSQNQGSRLRTGSRACDTALQQADRAAPSRRPRCGRARGVTRARRPDKGLVHLHRPRRDAGAGLVGSPALVHAPIPPFRS